MKLVFRVILTALAVMLAASIVPGVHVSGFWTAVLVAIVLGILNVTLGFLLKLLTFPLSLLTFGMFLLVVNSIVFWAASFVKGFSVDGFWPAFFGSLIVTLISMAGKELLKNR